MCHVMLNYLQELLVLLGITRMILPLIRQKVYFWGNFCFTQICEESTENFMTFKRVYNDAKGFEIRRAVL